MQNNLPSNWVRCKLEDICYLDNGNKVSGVNMPLLDVKYIRGKKEAEYRSSGVILEPNDYVILVDGENSGEIFQIHEKGIMGSTFKKVSFKTKETIRYALYVIRSCQKLFRENKKGSAIPHLDKKLFKEYPINLPPLAEQKRIVGKIEELFAEVDKGIDLLKQKQAELKKYRQSVLSAAFSGKLYKTTNWQTVQLKDVCKDIQYGYTESSTTSPIGPKFLRITDIQDDSVNWDTVPYCKISDDSLRKYKLERGDFVFARTGATVGKSYLLEDVPETSIFASYLIRVRFKTQIVSKFVKYFFQSPEYWLQIIDKQAGIGQPNVNGTKLGQLEIVFPTLPEQEQIVAEIEQRFEKADILEKSIEDSLESAEKLKQSILKKAFEGKLVPQDPTDEPASVLLDRIKSEQKKGKKKCVK